MAKGYNKNQGSRFSDGIVSEGHITLNGSLYIPDVTVDEGPNDEDHGSIYLGDDNDLKIYTSDGSGVIQQQTASKDLIIQPQDGKAVTITKKGVPATKIANFTEGGSVDLYHNGSKKLKTTAGGVEIVGTAKAENAQVAGEPFVDNAKLTVAEIYFSEGSSTSDGAAIRWVSTSTNDNKGALDIRIDDDPSNTVANADKIRFRFDPSPMDVNGGAEYSLVEISAKRDGSTRMDLTTLVMDEGETRTSEVIADKFTGEATSVAALNNAAGTLDTDNLAEGTTNKYFSTSQVDTHIFVEIGAASGAGSLSYSAGAFTFNPVAEASYTQETEGDVVTTTHTKGIASFDETDFNISSGKVRLKNLGNSHIYSSAGIAYSKMENIAANSFLGNNTDAAASATAMSAEQARAVLGNIANGADNYDGWNINHKEDAADTATHAVTKIGSGGNVKFVGAGATKVTRSAGTVTITSSDSDTTYGASANHGMKLNNKNFEMKNDRRRQENNETVQTGQLHEYIKFHHNVNNGTDHKHGAIQFFTDNLEEMRLDKDGNLHVHQDIIGYSTTISDERLKENINVVTNALDKVSQLNGVTFNWINDGEASAGVIAQDIEKVLPSAVKEKELPLHYEGAVYKTVEYSQITALLIESVKELKEQNNQLRAEIEELKVNK